MHFSEALFLLQQLTKRPVAHKMQQRQNHSTNSVQCGGAKPTNFQTFLKTLRLLPRSR